MAKIRCDWCKNNDLYQKYHDNEWGEPVYDDEKLFEMLLLESFQAGLNWLTILKKREGFRTAFDKFDYRRISKYSEDKISELLQNEDIIRHRGKIEAAISNAKAFLNIQKEFGSFSNYIWAYVNGVPVFNAFASPEEVPAQTEVSQSISKDLKKRGFKFLGPTTVYAFMQATGMVNDHLTYCFKHKKSA
ncbi:DNA-3-methyladenine glycosylase I [Psychroflexus sp. YR1-1]|uniref:DNA-3-methyladenine glycosylase I n=1 Tax=Psychroflexus aurantiacus TaxID=2709310 RepID=A0A6B3R1T5_9FLAO|nr:DNA-3-methyladenine glycosylase I [Psychroflexus aurantiacus]NEV94606.1 DNA-3-methyladenine glycosylase I [Psychroflexus aurantiacus]